MKDFSFNMTKTFHEPIKRWDSHVHFVWSFPSYVPFVSFASHNGCCWRTWRSKFSKRSWEKACRNPHSMGRNCSGPHTRMAGCILEKPRYLTEATLCWNIAMHQCIDWQHHSKAVWFLLREGKSVYVRPGSIRSWKNPRLQHWMRGTVNFALGAANSSKHSSWRNVVEWSLLLTSKKVPPGNVFPSCALMKVIPSWANWFQCPSQHRILLWQWSLCASCTMAIIGIPLRATKESGWAFRVRIWVWRPLQHLEDFWLTYGQRLSRAVTDLRIEC